MKKYFCLGLALLLTAAVSTSCGYVEAGSAAQKNAAQKTAAQERGAAETRAEGTGAAETRPVETRTGETGAAETRAAETRAAETRATETGPAERRPSPEANAAANTSGISDTSSKEKELEAINALLVGCSYADSQTGDTTQWSGEAICAMLSTKLLWDNAYRSEARYTQDGKLAFSMERVQELSWDTLSRDYPASIRTDNAVVSGNELLVGIADGERTTLIAQNLSQMGERITVSGTAVFVDDISIHVLGRFSAEVKRNPSSVYGYTLVSLSKNEHLPQLTGITASASSELSEYGRTHIAQNAVDGSLQTAWVEGVSGVGINEWIRLSANDGSDMDLFALEFDPGYQKSDRTMERNGRPRKVLIECEDGWQQEAVFSGYTTTEAVVLNRPVKTSWIKITILEADAGTNYEDTCISEIRLYGTRDTGQTSKKHSRDSQFQQNDEKKEYSTHLGGQGKQNLDLQ